MKVILHVGMPKCGSSALQTFLSSRKFPELCAGSYAYAALRAGGVVVWGDELIEKATASPRSYFTSIKGKAISEFSADERDNALRALKALGTHYDTLILSKEGWGPNPDLFPGDCVFADNEFEVNVVFYVRPQVEWVNSAWWQWGAWLDLPFGSWVNRAREKASWLTFVRQWSTKPWVKQVDVRLLGKDVVQDFIGYLGYQVAPQPRFNQSLPEVVLRLFQRHRQLRPTAHKSAIEFVLARHMHLDQGKTPWVLDSELVKELLDYYRQENEMLVDALPVDQRQIMLDDPRWWKVEAYSKRPICEPVLQNMNLIDLKNLALAALEVIKQMGAKLPRNKLRDQDKLFLQQPNHELFVDRMTVSELEEMTVSALEVIHIMDARLRKLKI